jgi:hypothetical protein
MCVVYQCSKYRKEIKLRIGLLFLLTCRNGVVAGAHLWFSMLHIGVQKNAAELLNTNLSWKMSCNVVKKFKYVMICIIWMERSVPVYLHLQSGAPPLQVAVFRYSLPLNSEKISKLADLNLAD